MIEATNVTCRCPLMPVKSRQYLGNQTRAGTTTMVVTVVIEAPNVDVRFFLSSQVTCGVSKLFLR